MRRLISAGLLRLSGPVMAAPADRTTMLQDAFMATMQDQGFLADAKRQKLDVEPRDGACLTALIQRIYATPKPIVDRVAELIK